MVHDSPEDWSQGERPIAGVEGLEAAATDLSETTIIPRRASPSWRAPTAQSVRQVRAADRVIAAPPDETRGKEDQTPGVEGRDAAWTDHTQRTRGGGETTVYGEQEEGLHPHGGM